MAFFYPYDILFWTKTPIIEGAEMKQDFIAIADYSPAEIQSMLDLALDLKKELKAGGK
jgi:ornithine carbamoyltransferase